MHNLNQQAKSVRLSTPLETLFGQLPHGICQFDANDCLSFCNPQFQLMYDLPDAAVETGVACEKVFGYLKRRDQRTLLEEVIKARPGFADANQSWLTDDGRTITVSCEELPDGGYTILHECLHGSEQGQLGHANTTDPLTGVYNRSTFRKQLAHHVTVSVDSCEEISLLYLDLDRFKHINDTLGHTAGDEVLKEVTRRIEELIQPTDLFGRLGGDEFAILQVGARQPVGSRALANQILESISRPFYVDGNTAYIGISIGVAVAPFDAETDADLLKSADLAMYCAKHEGRNTLRYFEPEMDTAIQARKTLDAELRRALEREEFMVYYQPTLDVESNKIVGFEGLVRWQHPKLGCVSPADFIPLAEETGLIKPIGEWVLRQACRDAAKWNDDLRVAVNVSSVQLDNRSFFQTVVDALGDSGLEPHRLELEITETTLMCDTELTVAILTELREFGVRIALDDFGTGYSSISYLRSFPFDKIKIDRSFVTGSDNDSEAAALVKLITSLGFCLAVTTTAEGVETHSEMDMVRAAGCDQIQGYLLSKPIPSDQVMPLVRSSSQL